MDHVASVGVGHRLADRLEDRQEPRQLRLGPAFGQKVGERAALHQLHGEERAAVGQRAQLVDRHHAGMLELAADLRLLHEAADEVGAVAVAVEQDLQGQVASEVVVPAAVDGAHAAAGDLAEQAIAAGRGVDEAVRAATVGDRPLVGRVGVGQDDARDRPHLDGQAGQDAAAVGHDRLRADGEGQLAAGVRPGPTERQTREAGGDLGVVEPGQAAPRRAGGGEGGEALPRVAAVLSQVQADHRLDAGLLVGVEVAAGGEVLGQGPGLVASPGLESGDELALVDQADLEGEQAEEQVAVGSAGGHGAGLPEGRHGRWAFGPRRWGPPVGAPPDRLDYLTTERPMQPAAADRTSRAFDGPVTPTAGSCVLFSESARQPVDRIPPLSPEQDARVRAPSPGCSPPAHDSSCLGVRTTFSGRFASTAVEVVALSSKPTVALRLRSDDADAFPKRRPTGLATESGLRLPHRITHSGDHPRSPIGPTTPLVFRANAPFTRRAVQIDWKSESAVAAFSDPKDARIPGVGDAVSIRERTAHCRRIGSPVQRV